MDTPSGSVSLARAFIRLSNRRETGVLTVVGDSKRCRVSIISGTPCAVTSVPGEDEMIGDLLLREGRLDWSKHRQALVRGEAQSPVGEWLIEMGAASRAAVESALLEQHRSRLQRLFCWRKLDYRFDEGNARIGMPLISDPVPIVQLIFDLFRQIVDRDRTVQCDDENTDCVLHLTEIGRFLLDGLELSQEESPLRTLTERGCRKRAIYREIGGSERAILTLRTLRLLGAIVAKPDYSAPYSLLLRKRQQLRNSASPRVLLDLPAGASLSQARKALRKLARQLHPDRFGPDASPALHHASQQVMTALCCAEKDIREHLRNRLV